MSNLRHFVEAAYSIVFTVFMIYGHIYCIDYGHRLRIYFFKLYDSNYMVTNPTLLYWPSYPFLTFLVTFLLFQVWLVLLFCGTTEAKDKACRYMMVLVKDKRQNIAGTCR